MADGQARRLAEVSYSKGHSACQYNYVGASIFFAGAAEHSYLGKQMKVKAAEPSDFAVVLAGDSGAGPPEPLSDHMVDIVRSLYYLCVLFTVSVWIINVDHVKEGPATESSAITAAKGLGFTALSFICISTQEILLCSSCNSFVDTNKVVSAGRLH